METNEGKRPGTTASDASSEIAHGGLARRFPIPWNIPIALGFVRLIGAFVLVFVAYLGYEWGFLGLLVALLLTDWVDGKLARLLDQRTTFGARLDSIADVTLFAAGALGLWWLKTEIIAQQAAWILAAVLSYLLSLTVALIKFGRPPSYHTRGAKLSWFLVGVGVVVIFANGPLWPFQVAMAMVMLTNLEATAITIVLPEWQADIPTLYHALDHRESH